MAADPDDLIGATEVAEILGLSHRNSVSTYRRRYADFPPATRSPHGGRTLLWHRGEILAWHRAWADPDRRRGDGSARLEALVDAAASLLVAHPGTEIGVRQIAAAAGMAHSDLYRYADSKEQILELAAAQLVESFRMDMPGSPADLLANLPAVVAAILERRAAMRVVMAEVVRHPDSGLAPPTPTLALADLIRRARDETGRTGVASPETTAASVAALMWGWALLGPRMCQAMGLAEVPQEEITDLVRVLLES